MANPEMITGKRPRHCALRAVFLALTLACAGQLAQARLPVPSDLCRAAAQRAAQKTGVPLDVLMAISLTESGRRIDGTTAPWPWTLNIEGQGHWLETQEAALQMASATRDEGRLSFDVGCFQLNYRWHGEGFASLREMMEPDRNALYAAQFLANLFQETGNWSMAAGFYHSRTREYADRYRKLFDKHLAALGGAPDLPAPPLVQVAAAEMPNRFPLLQSGGGAPALGSLVPTQTGPVTGLLADRTTRPFWSGS